MVRGLIRNQLPGDRLRVRLPCPPLPDPRLSPGIFFAQTLSTQDPTHLRIAILGIQLIKMTRFAKRSGHWKFGLQSQHHFAAAISSQVA